MSRNQFAVAQVDGGGGGRSSSTTTEFVYDPVTGTWVEKSITNENGQSTGPSSSTSDNPPGSGSQVDSQTEAEKEYIEQEFTTLVGDIVLTCSTRSIRIKVNDTIQVKGLGKYLSGLYFVSSIKRTIDKDKGYSHSMQLIRNGFGDSLKKSQETVETREEEVAVTTPEVKVGDTVRIVGEDAVYSNASDGVKVPAWVKQNTYTIDAISDDGTRVRIKEIWSWTYLKYIQKV